MSRRAVPALGALVVCSCLWAQTMRIGPEFRVNDYTTSYQERPRVARNGTGAFVVVWQSKLQDGSSFGIFARRYNSAGASLGPEFQVNTYTTGDQTYPAVAMDGAGQFAVVWQSALQDGSQDGIYAQRFNGSGAPVGGEIRVNTYTANEQANASVDYDGSGNFVVAWDSSCGTTYACTGQDGQYGGIFAQRYTGGGALAGTEFRVNTYTRDYQSYATVGKSDSGNFVVAWQSYQDGSGQGPFNDGIIAQRFSSAGSKSGNDFETNSFTTDEQASPAIAVNGTGNFVVVWQGAYQDGSGYGVFGQRYTSAGAKVGGEFRVNTYTVSDQASPSVAIDNSGNFVVVWRSVLQDGWSNGIFGQRYDSSGVPRGLEFRVNTYTPYDQRSPSVDMDPATGNFVVVWSSAGQDGSFTGVFGQQFSANNCPATTVSAPSNQTACPGATVFLSVSATGFGPFAYQWRRNGINIPDGPSATGAKTATLKLTQVSSAMAGSYSCAVTDFCLPPAAMASAAASLTVATNGSLPGAVSNLRVQKINSGNNLKLTWDNSTSSTDYVVVQDSSTSGPFTTVTGSSSSGPTGLTIPTPSGNVNYLVAGRNSACGMGS